MELVGIIILLIIAFIVLGLLGWGFQFRGFLKTLWATFETFVWRV